jgi:hypothetical protein
MLHLSGKIREHRLRLLGLLAHAKQRVRQSLSDDAHELACSLAEFVSIAQKIRFIENVSIY